MGHHRVVAGIVVGLLAVAVVVILDDVLGRDLAALALTFLSVAGATIWEP